jgi:Lar family restriction alleviation protein
MATGSIKKQIVIDNQADAERLVDAMEEAERRAIKPCPFCGQEPRLESFGKPGDFQVWCPYCNCIHMGVFYERGTDAINAWNRRVQDGTGQGN